MKDAILIIDDKATLCNTLAQTFGQLGYQAVCATCRAEAFELLARHQIKTVLLDLKLGRENGIEVLQELRERYAGLPVIMMTGYASVDTAVQSLKLGAFDYVKKPLDFEQLIKVVESALATTSPAAPSASEGSKAALPTIITHNRAMLEVCDKARRLAVTDLPVLILGENGTGKEVLADLIHLTSARHSRAMLKINCAAFPETLLDNELFGHEKGAYTGADSEFRGVFERADRSSLFLDEIGDMPPLIQAKILRTLQSHEIRRLGGSRTITVNVRFVAATNKDLNKLIERERFRQDLYYRLKAAVLTIPPLRDRRDDIPLLTDHFLHEYSRESGSAPQRVSQPVRETLARYNWPGNVRELKNVVRYAAAICPNPVIELADLPPDFLEKPPEMVPDGALAEVEKNVILNMLEKTGYNKKRTAELLNIGRKTLYRKLEKYGICAPK